MIGLPYPAQLASKQTRLMRALSRYPALERVPSDPVVAAEDRVSYRTRAKLIAAPGGKLGLFAEGHQVIDIPSCRVLTPLPVSRADMVR